MNYADMRKELIDFYWYKLNEQSETFRALCMDKLNKMNFTDCNPAQMKVKQYEVITEHFTPVLFNSVPFYFEMGALSAHCDGAGEFRGHYSAGGWLYNRNKHIYEEKAPQLYELCETQKRELLYLICGVFCDERQHFYFNYRVVFQYGLKGLYEKALSQKAGAKTKQEITFLDAVCQGVLCLKRISAKFAKRAEELLKTAKTDKEKENFKRIAERAKIVPWEKPESLYDALNTYAILRKAVGALEGVGINSFIRPDLDLLPYYENDIKAGRLTKDEAYDLIAKFLVVWDCHYDHDMPMVGYSDHELENTYVLGGCDKDGKPVYNDLTEMFLRATREEEIIFPKIKCRFSANSPKAYLDAVNLDVINGRSMIIYCNDDVMIPAYVKAGKTLEEARDYVVTGCWGAFIPGVDMSDDAQYLNMLKAFEFALHNRQDKIQETGVQFTPYQGDESFEEIYKITIENIRRLVKEHARITSLCGPLWQEVDCLPLISMGIEGCLETRRDHTAGGAKYNDNKYFFIGLPNIVDSLLAIKTLCFDEKICTFKEMLDAVRANWVGYERLRTLALKCKHWGDESEESCELAGRFNVDLATMLEDVTGRYGGKSTAGHLTYTEIRWWGEKTLATPDGRKNGDYFSQGITPSRLHQIDNVTAVLNSTKALHNENCSGNSVINIILPSDKLTLDGLEAFLRATAQSGVQSLQLNCVTKKRLLEAQKNPEQHKDIIVRVTGFSARFTSLSKGWQDEFISRNFYQ